jgi:hypothetical protein
VIGQIWGELSYALPPPIGVGCFSSLPIDYGR